MAKRTAKSNKNSVIQIILNLIGAILLIALIPAILIVGVLGLIIFGAIALLEATGLKKRKPLIPHKPPPLRPEPWKPTQAHHKAMSTRAQLLRNHNKRVKEKPYALARGVKDDKTGE